MHGKLHSGDTVEVISADGAWLGRGAYSPASSIRVRIWTFDPDEVIDNSFFLRRIESALTGRTALNLPSNAMRLVAAECDGLPGLTIDRYADVVVCQLLSAGAERHRDKLHGRIWRILPEAAQPLAWQ
ncbi:MAG: 23S rRNA (cytosine(1962)-C(5))-methyltransferase RlmI, partial [Opitutaceae bacterium]|nr:23S rRNA (cytosine(1962)-C(5))-methyltransferase RlmI [Opitutaceae bacterium]